jgi:ketosteroid isomerase-like protein
MTDAADIIALSAAWDTALTANDAEAVARFMADEWVYVGPRGATPKASIVGWIASGQLQHFTMQMLGEPRVVIHGDTALMTARKASSGSWDGKGYTTDEWLSEVYLRTGGRWLCVLSHRCAVDG